MPIDIIGIIGILFDDTLHLAHQSLSLSALVRLELDKRLVADLRCTHSVLSQAGEEVGDEANLIPHGRIVFLTLLLRK